jgi:hypothetical protein
LGGGGGGSSSAPRSVDPNDLIGPAGFGPQRFVAIDRPLPYKIDFENQAAATAPAQEVVVTHQLDSDLDWSTFQFGGVGFGGTTVDVPAGRQAFQTRVRTTNPDGSPLLVDITGTLDRRTGLVTWALRSVDPATGQLPDAVQAGFLPPNDTTRRGEGFVLFSVSPKATATTGTSIDEQATVVFDVNASIATNVFTNTIDVGKPTSNVQALPAVTDTARFLVRWSGSDDANGSGVGTYDVFVSDNGGPFTLWQSQTTATSTLFAPVNGHTYAFYSVATDNAGNVQPTSASAQATTQITIKPPRVQSVTVNGGVLPQRSMVTSLTVTFNQVVTLAAGAFVLTPDAGGPAVALNPAVSVVNGQTVVSLTFTGAEIIGGSLADGRYTLTVVSANVRDALDAALDGDGNGQAGGDNVTRLFRLYGDGNGDGAVNGLDLTAFRSAFGTVSNDAGYVAFLDFNGDGTINGTDLTQFRNRFGVILP